MAACMLSFVRCVFDPQASVMQFPHGTRVVFVRSGTADALVDGGPAALKADTATITRGTLELRSREAEVWIWELARRDARCPVEPGALTRRSFYPIEAKPGIRYALRCDRVSFPPGGIAYTHVHAAAGVRCIDTGLIHIDSLGHRWTAEPGDTWLERGPERVWAQADERGPASFVRVMLVPESHWQRSTITYVLPEDVERPKPQQYVRYVEAPVDVEILRAPTGDR